MRSLLNLTLFSLLLYSATAFAEEQNVADEMKRRQTILYRQLQDADTPAKRMAILRKLGQIQGLYYDPDLRIEYIRKANPGYADLVSASRLSAEPSNANANKERSKNWEDIPGNEKFLICEQLRKECQKSDYGLDYCRLYVSRCKDYTSDFEYRAIIEKFQKRPGQ